MGRIQLILWVTMISMCHSMKLLITTHTEILSAEGVIADMPEECEKLGICESLTNYPNDVANKLVEEFQRKNQSQFFNKDIMYDNFQTRSSFGTEVLCESTSTLYTPTWARDIKNETYPIINPKDSPVQQFRVEICQYTEKNEHDNKCSSKITFQNGYSGFCEQKYIYREMIAIDKNNKSYKSHFRIPSGCCCTFESY